MSAVRDLVDELRRRGVTVQEWDGWDGRGNSDGGSGPRIPQITPVGAVIHHTGSSYGAAYDGLVSSTRADLFGGCVCNFAGNEDGSLTVVASGLAWHAGPGVGPSLGPVLAAIPNIRNRMNRLTVGLEIVYPGDQPMRPEQYRAACIFSKTVADLFAGGDIECVRAHAETNGNAPGGSGKWDPGCGPDQTIDMDAFRRDASQITSEEFTVSQYDDIMAAIKQVRDEAWQQHKDMAGFNGTIVGNVARILVGNHTDGDDRLTDLWNAIRAIAPAGVDMEALKAAMSSVGPVDVDALAKKLADEADRRARDGDPTTGPNS